MGEIPIHIAVGGGYRKGRIPPTCIKGEPMIRPKKVDPNTFRGISNMSKQDQERLIQCIFCAKDPRTCNCTEADEDENGMCLKYERRADV